MIKELLASCHPSFRGVAYVACTNFLGRGFSLASSFVSYFFTTEMTQIYTGTHIDSGTLLLFQSLYMIPVFLCGAGIFFGIERDSYSLTLYPLICLLLVILLRYGSEFSLLIIQWDHYSTTKIPAVIFFDLAIDVVAIILLLLYVYYHLASPQFHIYGQNGKYPPSVSRQDSRASALMSYSPEVALNVPQNANNVVLLQNEIKGSNNESPPPVRPPKFQYPRRKAPGDPEMIKRPLVKQGGQDHPDKEFYDNTELARLLADKQLEDEIIDEVTLDRSGPDSDKAKALLAVKAAQVASQEPREQRRSWKLIPDEDLSQEDINETQAVECDRLQEEDRGDVMLQDIEEQDEEEYNSGNDNNVPAVSIIISPTGIMDPDENESAFKATSV